MSCATIKNIPLTSVVLVSYNTGPDLFATIDSALRQAAPVEVIVVNNGNPDKDVARLRRMSEGESRFSLIDGHGNVGFARGNNLGVKASRGEYVLILNPDCVLADDTLLKLHGHAAVIPSPFMIGARILNTDGSDQRGCRRQLLTPASAFIEALHLSRFFPKQRLNQHEDPIPSAILPIPAISGAFMFLPRKDYDLIEGFDEGYFLHVEDLDFCFRFRKAGGEIYFAPDVPVTHIGATSDAASDYIERHKTRGFSRYFHNNFKNKYSALFLGCLDLAIWSRYALRSFFRRKKKAKK